jgi:hypothetical protein
MMKRQIDMPTTDKSEYLYILINKALPNYYKLGQTIKHPKERLKTHNTDKTRLLGKLVQITKTPWQLLYYVPVTNARKAESATLWNDILPRWDNLELFHDNIIPAVEDLKKNHYLDTERYQELLRSELLDYDYISTLESLQNDWNNEQLCAEARNIVDQCKEERSNNDKRHINGSWPF